MIFTDKYYGHNYRTDHDFEVSEEILQAVKNQLRESLNGAGEAV